MDAKISDLAKNIFSVKKNREEIKKHIKKNGSIVGCKVKFAGKSYLITDNPLKGIRKNIKDFKRKLERDLNL